MNCNFKQAMALQARSSIYEFRVFEVHFRRTLSLYKNTFYKDIAAEICQILRNSLRRNPWLKF